MCQCVTKTLESPEGRKVRPSDHQDASARLSLREGNIRPRWSTTCSCCCPGGQCSLRSISQRIACMSSASLATAAAFSCSAPCTTGKPFGVHTHMAAVILAGAVDREEHDPPASWENAPARVPDLEPSSSRRPSQLQPRFGPLAEHVLCTSVVLRSSTNTNDL